MIRLFIVIAIMCFFAYRAQQYEQKGNIFFAIVVFAYILYAGLRTGYNDTAQYISSFSGAVPLSEFLADPDKTDIFHNPLFYGFSSWMRGMTENYHIFFMVLAIFDAILLIRFIRNHSFGHFSYAILLFWGFGIGMLGIAALKQITAMAILTLAYDDLLNHRWIRFFLLVVIAALVHTYAILFLVMPFFLSRPWNWKTTLLIIGTGMVLLAFNLTIASVLDYADELGKSVSSSEVFDGHGMNPFRVMVYAVPPAALFVFRDRLVPNMDRDQFALANMSIISFMFVLLGSVQGANMFGRLASYFMFGNICLLGWIIEELFNRESQIVVYTFSSLMFLAFIYVDNLYIDAYGGYTSISLLEFMRELIFV